ncbi:Hsp20/alpha crystallin family protein [Consotaella aegiceratis]|uniref:Hsp20/alpha crystallin family protein n=1 Tax=Consotaella aegiceratis TaxID=3097961 RepID=UPI002F401DBE
MNVRDLIPWTRSDKLTPQPPYGTLNESPFLALHREMNRLFDDAFRNFGNPLALDRPAFAQGWPSVEVSETDKEVKVTAEMPGLDEKDVEVLLDDGVLTLRGEKKSEIEDKERQFSERYFGHFERRIPLGDDVEEETVQASFKNGVLTVVLPKTEKARARTKRIPINGQSELHSR